MLWPGCWERKKQNKKCVYRWIWSVLLFVVVFAIIIYWTCLFILIPLLYDL